MLNEERVKHMVKLAYYETKGGNEEIKISSYFKKDYISLNTLWSIIWMTIAYVLVVVFVWSALKDFASADLTRTQILSLIVLIAGIYMALLIAYMVVARRFYKKKHARAYHRVKRFKEDLAELERMYAKEDDNGEDVRDKGISR